MATNAAQGHAPAPSKKQALDWILASEGGYAERPLEGGGAVNRGITMTTFRAWRFSRGKPSPTFADLKAMPLAEAEEIYEVEIFKPIRFSELPPGVDYMLADSTTNNGLGGMCKILGAATMHPDQRQFGVVLFWSVMHHDRATLVNAFCDARAARQKTFANYPVRINPAKPRTWGDAWDERNALVRKRALAMIQGVVA